MFIKHGVKAIKMINSRDLKDLHPIVAAMCEKFVLTCKLHGIDVLIYSTLRDNESQSANYAIGRTVMGANPTKKKPMGNTVTNARAGESYHNYGLAFDFVPIVNGKTDWGNDKLYKRCGEIAESVGLEWAGRWKGSLLEKAHCQYTNGLHWSDLKLGKQIS